MTNEQIEKRIADSEREVSWLESEQCQQTPVIAAICRSRLNIPSNQLNVVQGERIQHVEELLTKWEKKQAEQKQVKDKLPPIQHIVTL